MTTGWVDSPQGPLVLFGAPDDHDVIVSMRHKILLMAVIAAAVVAMWTFATTPGAAIPVESSHVDVTTIRSDPADVGVFVTADLPG